MTRINVHARGNEAFDMKYDGRSTLIGWFNLESCTDQIAEATAWDGNNHRGVISGLQIGHECLLRTSQGRWVRHYDSTNEFNGPEYYEFIEADEAKDWLIRAQTSEASEVLEKYFGELEEESGPSVGGRPEVGPAFSVRFPQDLIDRIEEARGSTSRAQWLREAAEFRLAGESAAG